MSTLDGGHALFAVDVGPQKLGLAMVHLGVKLRAHRRDSRPKIGYSIYAGLRILQDCWPVLPQDRR